MGDEKLFSRVKKRIVLAKRLDDAWAESYVQDTKALMKLIPSSEVEEQKEESKGDASPSTPTVGNCKDNQVGEDAPGRIWAFLREGSGAWHTMRLKDSDVEYVRADLASTSDWQDISTAPKPGIPIRVFSKDFIDPDFNPSGCMEAYWQEDEGWICAVWNAEFDGWDAKVGHPTHWREDLPPAVSKLAPASASARLSNDTEQGQASPLPSSNQKVGE